MRAVRFVWVGRGLVAAAIITFVVVNAFNALNKGGDASDFFTGGARALRGMPLYDGSGPARGFVGPPFQALFFAPFAAIAERSEATAKLLWYAISVVSLSCGLAFWYLACSTAMSRWPLPQSMHVRNVIVAVAAIILPLQTNFEHQNMNALLLCALGAGTWALMVERPRTAGVLFGCAAALKVFPALVIVYLGARRLWKAFFGAVLAAVVLTALPVLIYGPSQFLAQLRAWFQIGSGGWPARFHNQSLIAAVDRLTGAWNAPGIRTAGEAPVVVVGFAVIACALVSLAIIVFSRHEWHVRRVPNEIASVVVLSILLSPIAWDHYWVLLFPAFLLVRYGAHRALLGKASTYTFWVAAGLVSGISRITVGIAGWNFARRLSVSTVAATLLYVALLRLSDSTSEATHAGLGQQQPDAP